MDSCNVPQPKAEKSTANSHQNGHQVLHQLGGKIAKNPADKKSDSNSPRPRSVSDGSLDTFGHKSAVGQMVANRLEAAPRSSCCQRSLLNLGNCRITERSRLSPSIAFATRQSPQTLGVIVTLHLKSSMPSSVACMWRRLASNRVEGAQKREPGLRQRSGQDQPPSCECPDSNEQPIWIEGTERASCAISATIPGTACPRWRGVPLQAHFEPI